MAHGKLSTLLLKGLVYGLLLPRALGEGTSSQLPRSSITFDVRNSASPTLFPGYGGYKLQGCFSRLGKAGDGAVLGEDFIMPTNASMAEQMTVPFCLDACAAATVENISTYDFVAVGDGRECYCGKTLSSSSSKAVDENCATPCTGDGTVSCGGVGFVLVYTFIDNSAVVHDSGDPGALSTPSYDDTTAADTTTDTQSGATPSGRAAAIALGTIFGLLALAGLLWVGIHLYRRHQKSNTHHPPDNGATLPTTASSPTPPRNPGSHPTRIPHPWSALHTVVVNNRIHPSPLTSPVRERRHHNHHPDGLPAFPTPGDTHTQASTSAVRPPGSLLLLPVEGPLSPVSTTDLDTPSTGILDVGYDGPGGPPSPEAVARAEDGLGERAWHRRRWSRGVAAPLPGLGPGQGGRVSVHADSLLPAPLRLPVRRRRSAGEEDEDGDLTLGLAPAWTIHTVGSRSSLGDVPEVPPVPAVSGRAE